MELGKDIITIAPDGTPCAFQLKGHPSGRITSKGMTHLLPQLQQLTALAITRPGLPKKPHKSFLVTNGQLEEEAVLLIEQLNESNVLAGYPERHVHILQRGDLLAMARELGQSLWPTEIPQVHLLLQMLVEAGNGAFPVARANRMLGDVLGLSARQAWGAAEVKRRITSAALMTSLSLMNFNASQNHAASVTAWTQFAAAALGACERYGISVKKNAAASVDLASTAMRDSLIDLARETLDRDVLVEGDAIVDGPFYRARYTSLLGFLSLLWFRCEREGWPADVREEDVRDFLLEGKDQLFIWGEGALPHALLYYWFSRQHKSANQTEALLAGLLMATTRTDAEKKPLGLPSPYWTFDSVSRHWLAPLLGSEGDEMARESTGSHSYFTEALLHLLVRTNRKKTCKQLWPDVTRTIFVKFVPRKTWQYCLSQADEGAAHHYQPPLRKEWQLLVDEARSVKCETAPASMIERPMLHAAFLLTFPYRATPDVIRRLARTFDKSWLLADPPLEPA